MAVRSRSSLRFAVRRDDHGAGHHDDDRDDFDDARLSSPPAKRPRLQQQPSSRRRKSSPDLLNTTIENPNHSSSKTPQFVRHATHSPLPPSRSSTRRPLPLSAVGDRASSSASSASVSSSSSASSARVLPVGTPCTTGQTNDRHHTPLSTSAALYMRGGGRESPDPLDTISPAPATKIIPPRRAPTTSTPNSTTRSTRHSTRSQPHPSSDGASENLPARSHSRSSRKATTVNHASESQPLPQVQSPSQSQLQPQSQSQPNGEHPTASPAAPEQRRSLRSNDTGLRARSELAPYFWNYEQILSLEPPKTTELLTENTSIKLIDDLSKPLAALIPPLEPESPFGNPLLQLHECEKITLPKPDPASGPTTATADLVDEDPLDEGHYFRAHRRMERQEKQLRNIERERAQHEKLQLERLLDELKGHDWPRVMGLTGIADPEKKLYEPKRDYFIKEISSLIKKFQIWKEEEKRRKLEKEKSSAHAESTPPAAATSQPPRRKRLSEALDEPTANGAGHGVPGSDDPDPSDVDAWAAHQLQQEARSATGGKRSKSSTDGPRRRKSSGNKPAISTSAPPAHPTPAPAQIPTPPPPDQPFTSFFAKPHLREAALGPHRKGHVRMAFGHPLPKLEEREFQPPVDILTPEAIDACRRKRRRMRRESRG
ncbi:acetyltransferase SAS4-like domain-containing protein [Aspergillus clavatus NRRL 1]|uniref:Something about silencing protein 4 domain-containing protein n=1 Tax=Aspergillus clavatus (strain ATCC 1007 / CBS 513.65 / DSM 816 / NCTC 3887 / NRRL 1 / QM 1276 / 107) TaxID=344612 RepID=A1C447_ASPCL|nr:uncharacterized protein ACLA_058450 [Aspergillus clavatus NRRL 1]EAW15187.1 conserved hypothetical protein [Aspergillus clavatus NRRL 1]